MQIKVVQTQQDRRHSNIFRNMDEDKMTQISGGQVINVFLYSSVYIHVIPW